MKPYGFASGMREKAGSFLLFRSARAIFAKENG